MRFVDEFRDAERRARWPPKIAALCEPGRQYKFMEVCGGHTHTIYKHGLEDYLPEAITLVHGPGCPVCVIPMGRVDDAIHIAGQPDVIMTSFGDMMRVPGGNGSFFDAKAEGTNIRMVYSPLDSLKIARQNPDKRVVFMAIGFETTAPSTAMTVLRAEAEGIDELLGVLQPRHDHPGHQGDPGLPRPAPGRLHRPGPRVHRDRLPAVRVHRPRLRQAAGGGRVRAAGHPAVDLHADAAAARGPLARWRTSTPGWCPWDGNPVALKAIGETMELRPYFEWRGLGFISHSALQVREEYAAFDAELLFDVPGVRVADPKACQCGEVLKGVLKPWECKVFGTACTPETPIGTCMVSPEGACAAYYNFGRLNRQRVPEAISHRAEPAMTTGTAERGRIPAADREQQVLDRIERARRRRPRVREERITMSHGAGGKATQTLIEAIFLDAFRNPLLEPLEDAARLADGRERRRVALTTDSFVVSPLFFPGGNIGDLAVNGTVNDLAVAGATPLYLSAGFILEEGFPVADLTRIAESMRDAAARRRGAGGHRRHQGRAARQGRRLLHQHRRRRRRPSRACTSAWRTPGRGTRSSSPGRSATTASRSCWPGASWTSRRTWSPTPRRWRNWWPGCSPRCPGSARCATRPGAAWRRSSTRSPGPPTSACWSTRTPSRCAPRSAARAELLGIDPLYVACEGRLVAVVDGGQAEQALAALRAHPLGAQAAIIGQVTADPPGMVLLKTAFGGTRIVDLLVGDPLPRIC